MLKRILEDMLEDMSIEMLDSEDISIEILDNMSEKHARKNEIC